MIFISFFLLFCTLNSIYKLINPIKTSTNNPSRKSVVLKVLMINVS